MEVLRSGGAAILGEQQAQGSAHGVPGTASELPDAQMRRPSFGRYVAVRLLAMVPILALLHVFAFVLVELVPGDPARAVAGDTATPEQVEAVRTELGLDRPLAERFLEYTGRVVHGDFGRSLTVAPGSDVWGMIRGALPSTLSIGLAALVLATVLGIPVGALAAVRRDRLADHVLNVVVSVLLAVPPFVVGPLLVWFLSLRSGVLPFGGYVPPSDGIGPWIKHLVLPAIALGLAPAAEVARQVRGSMVTVMEESYIRTAHAKGLAPWRVISHHALKNAAIPTVTTLGLHVTRILGGSVLIEGVFAINGLGSLTVSAVRAVDLALVQGIVLLSGVIVLITNLLVDISYGFLNPRLRR